jgi:kumamolisin
MSVSRMLCLVVVMLMVVAACTPGRAVDDGPQGRGRHVPPLVSDAIQGAPVDGNTLLDLRIALPLHHEQELGALIDALYDPNSSQFGHYLTQAQFAARYLPDANDVAHVQEALGAQHLNVEPTPQGTLLRVTGRAADVEAAMGTTLYSYMAPDGTPFTAPATELQLPEGLPIVGVHGLVQGLGPHAQYRRAPIVHNPLALTAGQPPLNANAIRAAYAVPASLQGEGQSVGLFQLDHYDPNDVRRYCTQNSLRMPTINVVLIDGAPAYVTDPNVQVEVTLDIELLHAMAPQLTEIRLYQGPTKSNFQNYLDVLNEMANPSQGDRKLLRILSTSYGYFENELSNASLQTEGAIFKQMAAQGQSFFAAAGDTGAYANPQTPNALAVIDPAAQPYVTAVGGTRLKVGTGGAYSTETTWADGGGGVSRLWPAPSYQAGLSRYATSLGSTQARNMPDIALNADPNTGYGIYVHNTLVQVGGTSCGAPIWAGIMALINGERASQSQAPLGFFNPTLYRLMEAASGPTVMHDIVSGQNGYYSAATGYDNVTGWGTPQSTALLAAFFQSAPRRTITAPSWTLR